MDSVSLLRHPRTRERASVEFRARPGTDRHSGPPIDPQVTIEPYRPETVGYLGARDSDGFREVSPPFAYSELGQHRVPSPSGQGSALCAPNRSVGYGRAVSARNRGYLGIRDSEGFRRDPLPFTSARAGPVSGPSGRGSACRAPTSAQITVEPIRAETADLSGSVTRMGCVRCPRRSPAWIQGCCRVSSPSGRGSAFRAPAGPGKYDKTDPGRKLGYLGIRDSDGFRKVSPPFAYVGSGQYRPRPGRDRLFVP